MRWCLGGRSGWSYCVCTWSFLETAKSQATWALHLKPHPQSYCVLDSLSLHMHLWHRYFWELSQLRHLHLSLSPPVRLRTARCGSNGFLFFAVVLIVHQVSPLVKSLLAPWRAEPQNRKGTESGRPLGQVCTILQIQVKCLLSLLVVLAIWMVDESWSDLFSIHQVENFTLLELELEHLCLSASYFEHQKIVIAELGALLVFCSKFWFHSIPENFNWISGPLSLKIYHW